jgi:uncharacterized membrane protein YdbT with pleckstrin-like domain
MWRALTPYLVMAALVMLAAAVAYGLGAPAWLAYAAIVLAILTVLPGYDRWERHQHPR